MKVRDLIADLAELPLDADVVVAVESVTDDENGEDVETVNNDVHAVKFEDGEVIIELG